MQLFDPESLNSFQRFHVLNLIWILKQRFVFWFEHWKIKCNPFKCNSFGSLIKYSWELVSLLSKHDRFTSSLIYQKLEKNSNISSNLAKKRLHLKGLKISCLPLPVDYGRLNWRLRGLDLARSWAQSPARLFIRLLRVRVVNNSRQVTS